MKYVCGVVAVLMAVFSLAGLATAADRVALVVGADDYANVPKLEKAVGDAQAVGAKLRELGFDVAVTLNPDRSALVHALADLRNRARGASLVVVHFSGHGVALDGENYLLPVDVSKPGLDKQLLEDESISQSQLIQKLTADKGENRSLVLVIDACRDNPYMDTTRSVGGERGLSRVEPPRGVFIMYSAGFGETALDSLGGGDKEPTSVYTRVLLKQLSRPGANLIDIANDARTEVEGLAAGIGHQQSPANYDQLDGRKIVLLPAEAPKAPVMREMTEAAPPVPPAPTPPPADDIARAFEAAKQIGTPDALEAFISQYPDSFYAKLAQVLLKDMKKEAVVVPAAPPAPPPEPAPPPADPAAPVAPPAEPSNGQACTPEKGPWSVAGRDADDTLYLRSGPGPGYGVVFRVPPGTHGLVRGTCAEGGRWCEVRYECHSGWAAMRFLRLDQDAATPGPDTAGQAVRHMRVVGIEGHDTLRVRLAPDPSSAEVGDLPPHAGDVELGQCTRAGGGASWCQVSWHGIHGWANARYLARD